MGIENLYSRFSKWFSSCLEKAQAGCSFAGANFFGTKERLAASFKIRERILEAGQIERATGVF